MRQVNQQSKINQTKDIPTAWILSRLIWVSWAVFGLAIFSGCYFQDWKLVSISLSACAFQILPLASLKRGNLLASSLLVVLSMLAAVTLIATIGQGVRDLAVVAYPIVIIFAGLTLNRRLFLVSVGLALLAVCWLVLGEIFGLFTTVPFDGEAANWFYLIEATALLLVAAIAVDLLASNMRANLEQAHQEIAQRQQTEAVLRDKEVQYKNLADPGIALIWTSGPDKLCNYFNLPWLKFTGRSLEQEIGSGWTEGVHPDDLEGCFLTYTTAFDQRQAFTMEYRLRHASGEYRWIQDLGNPNYNADGEFIGYIGHCFDIHERKNLEEQLRFQGSHDSMTGIYNRNFFEEELARFERGREYPISIVIADVDEFKIVNDSLGHAAGDEILKRVANLLKPVFRNGDVLARIGGDEFAALLPDTNAADVDLILARIKKHLDEYNASQPGLPLRLSLGAATAWMGPLADSFTLADQRMYADKAVHKTPRSPAPG